MTMLERNRRDYDPQSFAWLMERFWTELRAVCDKHQMPPGPILNMRNKLREVVAARYELIVRLRERCKQTRSSNKGPISFGEQGAPLSTMTIAHLFGSDHSTVVLALQNTMKTKAYWSADVLGAS